MQGFRKGVENSPLLVNVFTATLEIFGNRIQIGEKMKVKIMQCLLWKHEEIWGKKQYQSGKIFRLLLKEHNINWK